MEEKPNTGMSPLCIGILAHVDAGKTTLSEALLYTSGALRRLGRVDHADAFLDTDPQERERGITIFSKQARLTWKNRAMTLLDTPGHVDFSGETERTLPVLDAAILVVSGTDGVQGHTRTLWRLLRRNHVPTFLFINKTDLPGVNRAARMQELRSLLSPECADFSGTDWMEQAAAESEAALESFLSAGTIPPEEVRRLITEEKLFPCLFGAALRLDGVEKLLDTLALYAPVKPAGDAFGARVYKISRDAQGARLTWLRVTGGELRARAAVKVPTENGETEEKIHQIRLYSGEKYELTDAVKAGTVCAVTGLTAAHSGDALGAEKGKNAALLEPVFTYRVHAEKADPHTVLEKLRLLEEEDPLLHVVYDEAAREIRVQLMGEVQLEILERLCRSRFGLEITFGEGGILYRETIAAPVEGVGHYEPLRHYAEVHLLLEPLERGSGLVFASKCSTDALDLNWQRLILTHLAEKEHRGVLTGSPITDMKITLAAGRAHLKHTEGGDFRQATYRAVRQGLMRAESILLEPWYDLRLELPNECVGRAMADIQRMGGRFDPPETENGVSVLTAAAPVAECANYLREVTAYSRGQGRVSLSLRGYEPCRDTQRVVEEIGYDPERDVANTADSVFCSHGAGYTVRWDEVEQHMHLESCLRAEKETTPAQESVPRGPSAPRTGAALDKELQAIYERTYGAVKQNRAFVPRSEREKPVPQPKAKPIPAGPEYLLVDGYNIIFAWDELKAVAADHLDAARQLLMDLLCNYQGVRQCRVILVFDAYRVPFHKEEIVAYNNIHVVYTKEAETADAYIEKTSHEIAKDHRVRVATSDGMEQLIVLGQGALRLSADSFHTEVMQAGEEIRETLRRLNRRERSDAVAEALRRAAENAGEK